MLATVSLSAMVGHLTMVFPQGEVALLSWKPHDPPTLDLPIAIKGRHSWERVLQRGDRLVLEPCVMMWSAVLEPPVKI